jgi:hypothetical protein
MTEKRKKKKISLHGHQYCMYTQLNSTKKNNHIVSGRKRQE